MTDSTEHAFDMNNCFSKSVQSDHDPLPKRKKK